MKSASISEIKKELNSLPEERLQELCLRMAKYKKENKELLNYLLFESHDEESYIESIKKEIDELFTEINRSNLYLVKKSLRKILRFTNKYIKYSGSKQTEIELLVYYLQKIKNSGIPIHKNTLLTNLYQQQLKKIEKALDTLHEDLQYDYRQAIEAIS
jgi:hypothetical protein